MKRRFPPRQSSGRADSPPAGRSAGSRAKYVYCIVRSAEPRRFGAIGLGGEPTQVHTVGFREITAVISDTPEEVLNATRENVLAHERVNETVMRNFTVIPMSFGTVFKTRDDIVELLRGAYDAFRDVLDKMQDKVEFGLKVLWDRDVMIRELENDDDDIRRLKNEIATVPGSTYFARMQYGRQIEAALQARSEQYVADIFAQLRDVSVAARANKPIGEKMIMNAAFLVSRDKETAFDAKVKEVGALYEKLNFRYTGPWPPYNFVNIRLKLERARVRVIILDTLLVGGLKFVLGKIAAAVEAEMADDTVWREELLAAQMRLELGEITERQFAKIERELLARIREIRERQQEPREPPGTFRVTGVEANVVSDDAFDEAGDRGVPRR